MRILLLISVLLVTMQVMAQKKVYISQSTGVTDSAILAEMDSMVFDAENFLVRFYAQESVNEYPLWRIESLFFGEDTQKKVEVSYSGSSVEIYNPFAFQGITITANGGHVIVNSVLDDEIEYILSGNAEDGSFKIYSDKKFILSLNGVSINSSDGSAINIQSGKKQQ